MEAHGAVRPLRAPTPNELRGGVLVAQQQQQHQPQPPQDTADVSSSADGDTAAPRWQHSVVDIRFPLSVTIVNVSENSAGTYAIRVIPRGVPRASQRRGEFAIVFGAPADVARDRSGAFVYRPASASPAAPRAPATFVGATFPCAMTAVAAADDDDGDATTRVWLCVPAEHYAPPLAGCARRVAAHAAYAAAAFNDDAPPLLHTVDAGDVARRLAADAGDSSWGTAAFPLWAMVAVAAAGCVVCAAAVTAVTVCVVWRTVRRRREARATPAAHQQQHERQHHLRRTSSRRVGRPTAVLAHSGANECRPRSSVLQRSGEHVHSARSSRALRSPLPAAAGDGGRAVFNPLWRT